MLMKTFVFLGPQWQKNPIHIVILDAKIFHNHAWLIIEENQRVSNFSADNFFVKKNEGQYRKFESPKKKNYYIFILNTKYEDF